MRKFDRICYVATPYTLLLYLLYSTKDEIENTFFVLDPLLPDCNIASSYRIKNNTFLKKLLITKWVLYKYIKWFKLPTIRKDTKLYVQDHLGFSSMLIGKRNYCLIEDSPGVFSSHLQEGQDRKNRMSQIKNWNYPILSFLFGRTFLKSLGENGQCDSVIMTKEDKAPYLSDKRKLFLNLDRASKELSAEHKQLIYNIFDIKNEDLDILRSKSVIVFSQPLFNMIPYEEHIKVYIKLLEKYNPKDVIIKTHPNDDVRYEDIIPFVSVFRKNIPSQLLSFEGISFDKAVTLFSTAVFGVNANSVDWYGDEFNDDIFKDCGKIETPKGFNKCELNIE